MDSHNLANLCVRLIYFDVGPDNHRQNKDLMFLAVTAFATGFGIFFNELLPLADVCRSSRFG